AAASGDAAAAGTQTETISLNTMSLNVAAARPTRGVSGAIPSSLEAPRTAETTMYVNGVSAGHLGTPPNGNTPSSAGVQVAAPSVQSNFAPPTAGSVAPIHSAGAAGTQAPEIALQANPIQVGVS